MGGIRQQKMKAETLTLTLDVDLGVLGLGSGLTRKLQVNRLVLGVVGTGKGNRGKDVKGDLPIRCRVVDRLELAAIEGSEMT